MLNMKRNSLILGGVLNKCILCQDSTTNSNYCDDCSVILKAINNKYNLSQVMELFSHILGAKITKQIAEAMYSALEYQYNIKH